MRWGTLLRSSLLPLILLAPVRAETPNKYEPAEPAPGSIRFRWIHGSICAATNRDPRIQVVRYNEDTFLLRENVAVHWQAPFTYLLVGETRALLIDSGATAEAAHYPLRQTVDGLLARAASLHGRKSMPLLIVHTSGEDTAQNQGAGQFAGRPETTVVPLDPAGMKKHFGWEKTWPRATAAIDLGGRVVTAIPTPGTHKDGVTFYDRYTGNLHTGDLVFPGRIEIGNDADFVPSIERLQSFVAGKPFRFILGGHIEMQNRPGQLYIMRTTYKPAEHVLQLPPEALDELLATAKKMVGQAMVSIRADFIVHNRVGPDVRGDWPADLPPAPPALPFMLR